MNVTASAPAKVILTGEHFVVYGEPAVVMAIDCYVHVTVSERSDRAIHIVSDLGISGFYTGNEYNPEKGGPQAESVLRPVNIAAKTVLDLLEEKTGLEIKVDSQIPIAAGLGSSGALAVATVAAVGKLLGTDFSRDELIKLSFESERFVHFEPSGIDQTISSSGGVMVYRKGKRPDPIEVKSEIPIVIGNTGIPRRTGDLVNAVKKRLNDFPEVLEPIVHAAGGLSSWAVKALLDGNLKRLGELMSINHGLLSAIGVSNEPLDRLVYAARKAGALGAKLTGAGGGGCMIALSTLEDREKIADAIREAGGAAIMAKKTNTGVQVWANE